MDLLNFMINCDDILPVVKFIRGIFTLIQWGIPIALIVMGSVDLGKAVLSSDDKEIKQATSKLIKRAIAAVAIFFIVVIVNLLMGLVGESGADDSDSDTWADCWEDAG